MYQVQNTKKTHQNSQPNKQKTQPNAPAVGQWLKLQTKEALLYVHESTQKPVV